jgi:biotin carboxyl carrier protein
MHSPKDPSLESLSIAEGTFVTRLTKKFKGRDKWEHPDPREVHSYIPGIVVRIMVKEGEHLTSGAPILTFESMKMENTLTMPYAGVVRCIHVKPGDVFAKDILLAEIDCA